MEKNRSCLAAENMASGTTITFSEIHRIPKTNKLLSVFTVNYIIANIQSYFASGFGCREIDRNSNNSHEMRSR